MPRRNSYPLRNIVRMSGSWWVRFFCDRKMLDRASFADSTHGGKQAALRAAQAWRDATELRLAPLRSATGLRLRPTANKKSGCPVGISASLRTDRRKPGWPRYLVFMVAYRSACGRRSNKVFQVGNISEVTPADSRHAALTAQACRDEYVWCRTQGQPFDPRRYTGWRKATLYPFVPPDSDSGSPS